MQQALEQSWIANVPGHGDEAVVLRDPGALDLLRAIKHANLSRVEQAVATALLTFVRSGTWWCPWEGPSAEGGVSVAKLAQAAKYSKRHTRRALIALEARGLVTIVSRAWKTNAYRLVADAWVTLAEQRRDLVTADRALHLDQLLEMEEPERRAVADLPASPPADDTPEWARALCRKVKARVGVVVELVKGTITRLMGDAPEDVCARDGGRAVHLWAKSGRPSLEVWLDQVDAVALAARECQAPRWRRLRGEGQEPVDAMAPRARQGGPTEDRSQSLRTLLRAAAWSDFVRLARAHELRACPCCGASSGVDEDLGASAAAGWSQGELGEQWLPDGQDGAVQAPAELVAWWNAIAARLVDVVGQADWQIWIAPITLEAVSDGVAWLAVPNVFFGRYIVQQWGDQLREQLGGPVGFVVRRE